jgi:WG containing repeat
MLTKIRGANALKQANRIVVIIFCLIACRVCLAQPQSEKQLFSIEKDGKSGFIDSSGRVVIAPQFDTAHGFSEGLAFVTRDGKKFFIDKTGRIVFEAKFDLVGNFSEGLAAVNIGETRIPNIGLIANPGKWGYIDKTGKLVLAMKYTHAESFSEGLAAIKEGDRGAFIDHSGKIIFEVPLDVTVGFHEGVAGVLYHGTLAYFDRTGKQISPPLGYGPRSYSFSEGLVTVEIKGKSGFMDRTGRMVIEPQFDDADNFSEGLAPVKIGSDETTWCPREESGSRKGFTMKWGFIDKTGKLVIPAQYESVSQFSEGLAAINSCNEAFFIDPTGKKVISGNFEFATPFFGGLASVEGTTKNGRWWGYIDKSGKMIWGPEKR